MVHGVGLSVCALDGEVQKSGRLTRPQDVHVASRLGRLDLLVSRDNTWTLEVKDTQEQDVGKILSFAIELDL